jgi:hypothetical protein
MNSIYKTILRYLTMILNLSQIKTEALLLFCKDLILSYKDSEQKLFNVNEEIDEYIIGVTEDFLKQIGRVTSDNDYYLYHRKHYRIKAILDAYDVINRAISYELKENTPFNPAMLYFSLLAVWFKELGKENKSKEYIYFLLYPYGQVYDKLLVNVEDEAFKAMNIAMIQLAEKVIYKLEGFSFSKQ